MQDIVWCGAGVKRGMLSCSPEELLLITGGLRADLAVEEEHRCEKAPSPPMTTTSLRSNNTHREPPCRKDQPPWPTEESFIAMPSTRPEDLTMDGGVIKRRLRLGDGGGSPSAGCAVQVHYTGRFASSQEVSGVFDSSFSKENGSSCKSGFQSRPFMTMIGSGAVIDGWEKTILTMEKGEICEVIIKPPYAYGAAGMPPRIPPSTTLRFHLWLVEIIWPDQLAAQKATGVAAVNTIPGGNNPLKLAVIGEGEGEEEENEEEYEASGLV